MRHRDTVESNSLRRVLGEIDATLIEVQHALEAYAENSDHSERLQPALRHLQKIRGTLELASLHGACVLADEMRRIARVLASGEVAHGETRRLESLIAATLRLSDYLQHIRAGSIDVPAVLLPAINDLRAYRGARPVDAAYVFRPDLSLVPSPLRKYPALSGTDMRRIRQRMNRALVLWFKGAEPTPFRAANQLSARLARHAGNDRLIQLWTLIAAIFEALADRGLDRNSMIVRRMVGRAANVLQVQLVRGDDAAAGEVSAEFLRSILLELASANSNGPLLGGVRGFWHLPALLPDEDLLQHARGVLEGPNMTLLESVVGTIKEELTRVKDALEIYVHGNDKNRALLDPLATLATDLRSTLSVLGIDSACDLLAEHVPDIERILTTTGAVENEPLLRLAGTLLDIDSRLDEYIAEHASLIPYRAAPAATAIGIRRLPEGEFNELLRQVTGECLINIAKVRDELLAYMENPDKQAVGLDQSLLLLNEIYGAATALPLKEMGPVAAHLARFIRRRYREQRQAPGEREQRLVADVVASMEYYLEAMQQDQSDLVGVIRHGIIAMRALEAEFPLGPSSPDPSSGPGRDPGPTVNATPDPIDNRSTQELPVLTLEGSEDNPLLDEGESLSGSLEEARDWLDDGELLPAEQAAADHQAEASEVEREIASAEVIDLSNARNERAASGPAPPAIDEAALAVVADDVDEEILEVFIEEAVDELGRISEFLPRWQKNPGDQEAMTTIRRSFHTLKGSGRLIGAYLIGEYAWSIENLINRLNDKSIPVSNAIFDLLDESAGLLPQLIEQLKGGPGPAASVGDLIARAHHMAATGQPMAVPDVTESAAANDVVEHSGEDVVANDDSAEGRAISSSEPVEIAAVQQRTVEEEAEVASLDESEAEAQVPVEVVPEDTVAEEFAGRLETENEPFAHDEAEVQEPVDEVPEDAVALEFADQFETEDEPFALDEAEVMDGLEGRDGFAVEANASMAAEREDAGAAELADESESFFLDEFAPDGADEFAGRDELDAGEDGSLAQEPEVEIAAGLTDASGSAAEAYTEGEFDAESGAHSRPPEDPLRAGQTPSFEADDATAAESGSGPDWAYPRSFAAAANQPADAADAEDPFEPAVLAESQPVDRDADQTIDSTEVIDTIEYDAPNLDGLAVDPDPTANAEALAATGSDSADTDAAGLADQEPSPAVDAEATVSADELAAILQAGDELDGSNTEATFAMWQQDVVETDTPDQVAAPDDDAESDSDAWPDYASSVSQDTDELVRTIVESSDASIGDDEDLAEAKPAAQRGVSDFDSEYEDYGDFGLPEEQNTEDGLLASFHLGSDSWASDDADAADDGEPEFASTLTPLERTESMDLGATEIDPVLLEIFTNESRIHLDTLRGLLAEADARNEPPPIDDDLIRALHTLHGSAQTAEVQPIASLSGALEKLSKLKRELGQPFRTQETDLLREGVVALDSALSWLAEPENEPPEVERICERAQVALARVEEAIQPAVVFEGQDAELLSIFIEEGEEILDTSDRLLEQWQANPGDRHLVEELKRQLHTLKGGARMAGFAPLADLSHATESLLGNYAESMRDGHAQALFELLHEAIDALTVTLEQARSGQVIGSIEWLKKELEDPRFEQLPAQRGESEERAEVESEAPADASVEAVADADREAIAAPVVEAQDVVRVRSDLIDDLVNYAGEVNIYHSRLGQTLGDYRFNISELEQTVFRLRDQLRKMDMETEAQILNRYEREVEQSVRGVEDFDPLEFDRYTRIQELSRALMESVSDLESIKGILNELTRDSETLLLQQSRVSTDLQDGLMRTRMVRFDRLAARFSRIVRQTANALKRKAELVITGGETEVDRSVQDHIIAPLEHMLRNAVSHGIESPEERIRVGKSATGVIELSLARDGGDVVLVLSDDGAGIDVEAVRAKALRQGLLDPSRHPSDRDLMQLVLENGLSTAATISQISGRGVGLGVVEKEIKQLGGSIEIESVPGKGTQFTVRLPLTLAINQALLISSAGENFAIPLASIEGVTQVNQEQLQAYYTDRHKLHQYAGSHYEVHHLGHLLGVGNPRFDDAHSYAPLVLIRSGDYRVALHAESLVGRREIVVKPVGAQVSTVKGVSGATIMADGQVVLILDVGALLRTGGVSSVIETEAAPPSLSKGPVIMVVDDSITIRKVTARMLERNQMNVVTAKDGMDALAVLTEKRPDLILLDIEMPRMDGYEVAAYVRNNPNLHDVPIIMITSRTGRKHRERAEELGVNRYLGKPYLESELLDNINDVLAELAVEV